MIYRVAIVLARNPGDAERIARRTMLEAWNARTRLDTVTASS